jgi:hypothetical protein
MILMATDVNKGLQRALDSATGPAGLEEEEPLAPDVPPDRTRMFASTSLSRMNVKTSWVGEEAALVAELHYAAEQAIKARFGHAVRVLDRLQEAARIPRHVSEATGEPERYADGSVKWLLDEHGNPVEDWSLLGDKLRSDVLFTITVHMYEWESLNIRAWAEAMFSKVMWEQAFSEGFRKLPGAAINGKPTIDDRTQFGHSYSVQERYFAVFLSALSRQAESLIRNMIRVQRLLENMPGH